MFVHLHPCYLGTTYDTREHCKSRPWLMNEQKCSRNYLPVCCRFAAVCGTKTASAQSIVHTSFHVVDAQYAHMYYGLCNNLHFHPNCKKYKDTYNGHPLGLGLCSGQTWTGVLMRTPTAENDQQLPHVPWFFTVMSAPFARQSMVAGGACRFNRSSCSLASGMSTSSWPSMACSLSGLWT